MKAKFITTILMCIIALAVVEAQTEKGKLLIGANTSLSISNVDGGVTGAEDTEKITSVKLQPNISYFIFDNFSAGIAGIYDYQTTYDGADVTIMTDFRYYFTDSRVKPFAKINAGYRNRDMQIIGTHYRYDTSAHGLILGGGLGLAFFLNNNISLDITGQYFLTKLNDMGDGYRKDGDTNSYKIKTTTQDLRLFVGMSFYF